MASKDQRRRQLAREKYERQQQRRTDARRKSRNRNLVIVSVVAVVGVILGTTAALGGFKAGNDGKDDKADPKSTPSTPPSPSKGPDPCKDKKPAPGKPGTKQWKKEPAMSIDKSASYTFTMKTTCGDIGITMDAAKAPHTVNSFNFLAGKGFFDHTKCHRLVDQGIYVLQCGDPKGTGQGGPGYTIPDENLKSKSLKGGVYPEGTVAMANTGKPHTGGSQFFLVYRDSKLPPQYTPFGTVDKAGMKVLMKIAKAGAQPQDATGNTAPNATVVIDKATVTKG